MAGTVTDQERADSDRLAELGYKQDLQRAWSSFSNFAISFTIISVLAGCSTAYQFAWNNGGPIAISWGWPIICGLILLVAFSMSEPCPPIRRGGICTGGHPSWAARPGLVHGWFNLIGLVGVVASIDYACASSSTSCCRSTSSTWG